MPSQSHQPAHEKDDDLVVAPLPDVAHDCRMSLKTLRKEIARGRGPKVT